MPLPLIAIAIDAATTALDAGGNALGAYTDIAERENNRKAKAEGRKNVVSDGFDEVLKFCDGAGTAICKWRDETGAKIRASAGDNQAACGAVDAIGTAVDCAMGFGKEVAVDIVQGGKHVSDFVGVKMGYGYDTLEEEGISWARELDQKEREDMPFGQRARREGLMGSMISIMREENGRDVVSRAVTGHGTIANESAATGVTLTAEQKREEVTENWADDRTRWQSSLYKAHVRGEVTDEQLAKIEALVANPDLGFDDKTLANSARTLERSGATWGDFADTVEEELTQSWYDDVSEQYESGRMTADEANELIDGYNDGTVSTTRLAALSQERRRTGVTWHQAMRAEKTLRDGAPEAQRKATENADAVRDKPSEDFAQGLKDANDYIEDRVERLMNDAAPMARKDDPAYKSRAELGLS